MFKMGCRVEKGLESMKEKFEEFVYQKGMAAIAERYQSLTEPKTYVNTILDVHQKYNKLNNDAFNNDFKESLDRASTKFINRFEFQGFNFCLKQI